MTKICVVCGKPFEGTYMQVSCSVECSDIRKMQKQKEARQRKKDQALAERERRMRIKSIPQVMAMAAARGISYGKMVQLLEKGAEQ